LRHENHGLFIQREVVAAVWVGARFGVLGGRCIKDVRFESSRDRGAEHAVPISGVKPSGPSVFMDEHEVLAQPAFLLR